MDRTTELFLFQELSPACLICRYRITSVNNLEQSGLKRGVQIHGRKVLKTEGLFMLLSWNVEEALGTFLPKDTSDCIDLLLLLSFRHLFSVLSTFLFWRSYAASFPFPARKDCFPLRSSAEQQVVLKILMKWKWFGTRHVSSNKHVIQ